MLLKRGIENMSESDESCESYSSDISNESNFYSETESDDSSESGNRFSIVGLYNNEPKYGEEEIKKNKRYEYDTVVIFQFDKQ